MDMKVAKMAAEEFARHFWRCASPDRGNADQGNLVDVFANAADSIASALRDIGTGGSHGMGGTESIGNAIIQFKDEISSTFGGMTEALSEIAEAIKQLANSRGGGKDWSAEFDR